MLQHWLRLYVFCAVLTAGVLRADDTESSRDNIVIADFEAKDYRAWNIEGQALGKRPASGTLVKQMPVAGYQGSGLVNSFSGGDASTGTATSKPFTIRRSHIAFLIGGGANVDEVGIELLIDGQTVRRATGRESETLDWASWNVEELNGQQATLRIYDQATGGWGHICVDQILQTDSPPDHQDLQSKLTAYRQSDSYMNEPLRPQYHFSPELNWMNDPNGLVYHKGDYHLFYQYNPEGNQWGHMSWGHAVSKDLLHWQHLPVAIPEVDGVMAFSGSCVVDHDNTAGFATTAEPPMVAIYTGHGHGRQVQNLAFSNDRGRSWTRYQNNPVLDIKQNDFRDPKVFWHQPTERWIMVVALAVERQILFYQSTNLKDWTELQRFGPAGTVTKPNWECPDLFELQVDNEPGVSKWVLEADIGDGAIAGGSGGEYFVGDFDGRKFRTEQSAQWVDYGRDFYAPISWDNLPASDGRRIWIGWFNNWQTSLVPTSPWRSCMSIPRELSLRKLSVNREEPAQYVLLQRPIAELKQLRHGTLELDADQASWPPIQLTKLGELSDLCFELEAELQPGTARSLGFRIRTDLDEYTEIGYDRTIPGIYVDRRKSGNVGFHPAFAGRHQAPARLVNGAVKLRIFVDRSSVEVFINDGEAVISDRIFPTCDQPVVEAFTGDASAKIKNVRLSPLRSVWQP